MAPLVFVCYARKDRDACEALRTALALPVRSGKIRSFVDVCIHPGADWRRTIETALGEAAVAVFLVSQDWMASEFIQSVELERLWDRFETGGITIHAALWSAVSNKVDFQPRVGGRTIDLSRVQWPARDGEKTIEAMSMPDQKAAWLLVAEAVVLSARARAYVDRGLAALADRKATDVRQLAESHAPTGMQFPTSDDAREAVRVVIERLLDLPDGATLVERFLADLGAPAAQPPPAPAAQTRPSPPGKPRVRARLEPRPDGSGWTLDTWRLDGGQQHLCSQVLAPDCVAQTLDLVSQAVQAQPSDIEHVELLAPVLDRHLDHRCWTCDPWELGPEPFEPDCPVHLRPLERHRADPWGDKLRKPYESRAGHWGAGAGRLVEVAPGREDTVKTTGDTGAALPAVPAAGKARRDRLVAVLRWGLPVLVWSTDPEQLDLTTLADAPLRELPRRFKDGVPHSHVLLYDDPDSPIAPDQLRSGDPHG